MSLTNPQRSYLKGLAHTLEPIVKVGRARLSDPLIAETARSLDSHELIKVRIDADESSERKALAGELAEKTSSELVGSIGKIAILYRAREEKPRIELPQ